ncbi:MAG: heme exporter protein CcmD [Paracoccaceae bacterium]|jgi:heme exporter protein CcmD|nr:heme exporter protein CcmD [Paracoccaceae bacterium]
MTLELGKYTSFVLSAYVITIVLLALLIIYVLWRNAKSKALLQDAELHKDA